MKNNTSAPVSLYRAFSIHAPEALHRAAEILGQRLTARGLVPGNEGEGLTFTLAVDPSLGNDAYRYETDGSMVRITGTCPVNVLSGCGTFLCGSSFRDGGMIPAEGAQTVCPDTSLRGVYFANHFHNYYVGAPVAEIAEYLADMALWGFNTVMVILPIINLHACGDAECMREIDHLADIFHAAAALGMKTVGCLSSSITYIEYPKELAFTPVPDEMGRHGNAGNVICPSKPGAQALLDRENRFLLEEMKKRGIVHDYIISWPYDEGGCGCKDCAPWGANGYLRASKRLFEIAREYNPSCKRILSTWTFDTPYLGEWEALSKSLEDDKWCDIILADAHTDYPRYPIDNGVPGGLELISFPEISMWGLGPWGGWGAVAFPERMTAIWRQTERKLRGELLYSEGIYEDLNKITVAGLCVDYDRDPAETLRRYARYELGCPDPEAFVKLVGLMEKNHVIRAFTEQGDTEIAAEALALCDSIDASLPAWGKTAWRWRIICIRMLLDERRFRGVDVNADPETLAAMHELIDIFHLQKNNITDPYHGRVRPICPEYEDEK